MLTTKEAAELLGITPRRVQELIKNGALEARKASGVWLIDKDSVDTRLRSVTKTGGRPRRGHGKSEIAFTLTPCGPRSAGRVMSIWERIRRFPPETLGRSRPVPGLEATSCA